LQLELSACLSPATQVRGRSISHLAASEDSRTVSSSGLVGKIEDFTLWSLGVRICRDIPRDEAKKLGGRLGCCVVAPLFA